MNLNTTLLKVFNINPNERTRVTLLILHSFFLGVYVSYFFTFANGIFLSTFEIKYLPFAYVLSGLLGFLFSTIFSYVQRKVKYYNLLVAVLVLVLFITMLFVFGFRVLTDTKSLVFIVFVFLGPIFSVMNLSFWGLTISLFDLREGKRLFGLIGSGDVISSILGYFSIPFVLRLLGDSSNLMIIAIIGLAISIVFQWIIITRVPEAKEVQNIASNKRPDSALSFKDIATNRYFRFIFLLVIFSLVGQYFVDYTFMGAARNEMKDQLQLTSFIGIFFGLVKVVELLFRTLAAGRLMSKYGIRLGLLILPGFLLFFTMVALLSYTIASYTVMFFLLLCMIKLIDKVIRRSMEEPAIKTLYQPVDTNTKLVLQTTIEGKGKQLAVVLAGGILVLFNLLPNFTIVAAASISCFIILAWIIFANKTYGEYRALLSRQLATSSDRNIITDVKGGWNQFNQGLNSNEPTTFQKSLNTLHSIKPVLLLPHYPTLINHSDKSIKHKILTWISELPTPSLYKTLENQSTEENDPKVEKIIEDLLNDINTITSISENDIPSLVRSEWPEERIKAAASICHFLPNDMVGFLDLLLKDKNQKVVKACCYYISTINDPVYLELLLNEVVKNKSYEHNVLKSLLLEGSNLNQIINTALRNKDKSKKYSLLEEALRSSESEPLVLLSIINLLGQTGNQEAQGLLKSSLYKSNWSIEYNILYNLKRLDFHASENDLMPFRQLIRKETAFCTWIIASINDLGKRPLFGELIDSLQEQLDSSKDKIFDILSFLYSKDAIAKIEINLKSGIQEKEVLAIEMADILLDEALKDIIFPLFDKIPIVEKIKKLNEHFPQAALNQEKRLKNIVLYNYALLNKVTKGFAIDCLIKTSMTTPHEVTAQIYGKDILLKEMAYISLFKLNEDIFNRYLSREPEKEYYHIKKIASGYMRHYEDTSRLTIIRSLKRHPLFNQVPYWKLYTIAHFFTPVVLDVIDTVSPESITAGSIQFILKGDFEISDADGDNMHYQAGEIVGLYDIELTKTTLSVTEKSVLLSTMNSSFNLMLEAYPSLRKFLYSSFLDSNVQEDIQNAEINEYIVDQYT